MSHETRSDSEHLPAPAPPGLFVVSRIRLLGTSVLRPKGRILPNFLCKSSLIPLNPDEEARSVLNPGQISELAFRPPKLGRRQK